jgi:oxygen-dependent protoporphyrinogen oxidase
MTRSPHTASPVAGTPRSSHHEVIVVGGGIAGLVAAWCLRDRDVVLLEASGRAGGRALSKTRDGYWVNLGAHIIDVTSGGVLANYAREFNLPVVVPQGSLLAVGMGRRLIRAGRPEVLPFRLPLDLAGRASLVRVGLRLRRALIPVRRAEHLRESQPPQIDRLDLDARLDDMTFSDVLGKMHPDVAALMRVTANRMGTEPDRVSGHRAVWNALGIWGSRRGNIAGGTAALTDAIASALGDRVWTGAAATRISQTQAEVSVEADLKGEPVHLTAETCVVAVPAPVVCDIVDDLPASKREALGRIPYGPYVVAGIFTDETSAMPWDDVYAAAVPGRSFSMLFNSANPARTAGHRTAGGSLVVYAAGDPAAELLALTDAEITDRFLGDLHGLLPQSRGAIKEVVVQRWPMGIPISVPGRARLQPQVAAPHGRLYFAGDYIVDPGLDSAAWTAQVAAEKARSVISGAEPHRTD